jgi:predicted PurR-regulated permease PerM
VSTAGQKAPRRRTTGDGSIARRALPIYVALVGALLTALGLLILIRLEHVLLLLFISMLLAAAMDGPVGFLERAGIPRLASASILQLLVVGAIGVGVWLGAPMLVDQATGLADTVPRRVQEFKGLQDSYNDLREQYPQLASFDAQLSSAGARIADAVGSRLVDLPLRLAGLLLDLLAISVLSALLVAKRERLQDFALGLVQVRHRQQTRTVLDEMWRRLGLYVRAKLIVMVIVGGLTFAALELIGVPYPLVLAVIVALGELIPQIGPWIARVPLFAVAALQGVTTLVIVVVVSFVVENLKGYVISPAVEGSQLNIDPLVVILAVLAGGALIGPLGALVAVPAAACIQVVCEEVLIPWRRRQVDVLDVDDLIDTSP